MQNTAGPTKTWYAVYDNNFCDYTNQYGIWGVGETLEKAKINALDNIRREKLPLRFVHLKKAIRLQKISAELSIKKLPREYKNRFYIRHITPELAVEFYVKGGTSPFRVRQDGLIDLDMLKVNRVPYPQLVQKLANGDIKTDPSIEHKFLHSKSGPALADYYKSTRYRYKWQIPIARKYFGKPDGYFKGEWRYAVYYFIASLPEQPEQAFVLWCDPKKAGKGSTFELITSSERPANPVYIEAITKWLADQHPDKTNSTK